MLTEMCDTTTIACLFPGYVITEEANPLFIEGMLLPEEEALICNAVPQRRKEFIAGRLCARRALAQLAIRDFPILMAMDRSPIWPPGIVGSISHAEGYCGVALARKTEIESVGFDAECVDGLNWDCWEQICTPKELSWIHSLPHKDQQRFVALIFSAKECFYKCQLTASKRWMNFHDITISVNPNIAEFETRFMVDTGHFFAKRSCHKGKFFFRGSYVFTGMTLRDCNNLGRI
jgi:4'-phosphopantetheinyl transferase EntD